MFGPYLFNQSPPPTVNHPPLPPPIPIEPRSMSADEKEAWRLAARANAEIITHYEKTFIDETKQIRMMEVRADLKLRRQLLTDEIRIDSSGELVREQQFLREKSRNFEFCNFKIISVPIIYYTQGCQREILSFDALLQSQKSICIFWELDRTDAGYYWRKFRKAGLQIKKRRGEGSDVIYQVIGLIIGTAEHVLLPKRPGFYLTEAGDWRYAGADDLTWEKVKRYAE